MNIYHTLVVTMNYDVDDKRRKVTFSAKEQLEPVQGLSSDNVVMIKTVESINNRRNLTVVVVGSKDPQQHELTSDGTVLSDTDAIDGADVLPVAFEKLRLELTHTPHKFSALMNDDVMSTSDARYFFMALGAQPSALTSLAQKLELRLPKLSDGKGNRACVWDLAHPYKIVDDERRAHHARSAIRVNVRA